MTQGRKVYQEELCYCKSVISEGHVGNISVGSHGKLSIFPEALGNQCMWLIPHHLENSTNSCPSAMKQFIKLQLECFITVVNPILISCSSKNATNLPKRSSSYDFQGLKVIQAEPGPLEPQEFRFLASVLWPAQLFLGTQVQQCVSHLAVKSKGMHPPLLGSSSLESQQEKHFFHICFSKFGLSICQSMVFTIEASECHLFWVDGDILFLLLSY